MRVVVGQLEKAPKPGKTREIERVVVHHDSSAKFGKADIALLQLEAGLDFWGNAKFSPMSLPTRRERAGMVCKISGWGMTDDNQESQVLRWGETRIVKIPRDVIRNDVETRKTDLIAVGNDPRAALGLGDSGSGLLCRRGTETHVYGVAWGILQPEHHDEPAGTVEWPAYYTSVHYNLKWIREQMGIPRQERGPWEPVITRSVKNERGNILIRFLRSVTRFFRRSNDEL